MTSIDSDQRRRFQIVAAALFAALLVVGGVVVAFNSEDPNRLNATGGTTTSRRLTPGVVVSTTRPQPTEVTFAPTTTTVLRPSATATTTTVAPKTEFRDAPAELVCTQTTPADPTPPKDWEPFWQTEPQPNDGLVLKICVEDATPKVGATVKLYVVAQDPDAQIGSGGCDIFVTWNSNSGSQCRDDVFAPPDEPKETPPEPKQPCCRTTMTYIHQYAEPGEWTIDVSAWSGPEDEPHPYSSYNSIELRVTAHR